MEPHQHTGSLSPFWTDPEQVDSFANRDPDRRLVQLLGSYTKPALVRILDVGCAGGRNTALLAEMEFDFRALDASGPMVARTRERIAAICGVTLARQRVCAGVMEDLSAFPDGSVDLIVALGIYHQASSLEQWQRAVAESGRVLKYGGLVLVSSFTPDSQPDGKPLNPVRNSCDMYGGFSSGHLCLLSADNHDKKMAEYGFEPDVPTETVRVETELGHRVTMNALYRKLGSGNTVV